VIHVPATFGAPGIELTKADALTFLFQWTEWDAGALATAGMFLPATSVTTAFLGDYTASTYPNPLKSSANGFTGNVGTVTPCSTCSDITPAAATATAHSAQATIGAM